jgi:ABC-type Fe3+ transport system permease subunit
MNGGFRCRCETYCLVAYTAGYIALAVTSVATSLGQVNTSLQEAPKVSFLGCYRELLFVLLRLETNAIKRVHDAGSYVPQMGANPFEPTKI